MSSFGAPPGLVSVVRDGMLLLSALALAPEAARDIDPDDVAFVELETARDSYFVGEPFVVRVRFGFERTFAEEHLAPIFRRALDVPAQIEASWLGELPGAEAVGAFVPASESEARSFASDAARSFALGDDVGTAALRDESRAGAPFTVLAFERAYVAERAGPLTVPGPALRFAWAEAFDEGFFGDRTARDVHEARVDAPPSTLSIRGWPEEGRPFGFGGAIGTFDVAVSVEPRELAIGETLSVELAITGTGNFGRFEPPRFEPEGFRLRGTRVETGRSELRVHYDLTPLEPADELPPVELVALRPNGTYERVRSSAVALDVRAASRPAADAPPGGAPSPVRSVPGERSRRASRLEPLLLGGAALSVVAAVLWIVLVRRARAGRPEPRAAAARAELMRRLDARAEPAELALPFAEYLSAWLGCTSQQVVTGDLEGRLTAAGTAPDLAVRCARLVERLVGARYGGPVPPDAHERVRSLVSELERTDGAR